MCLTETLSLAAEESLIVGKHLKSDFSMMVLSTPLPFPTP